METKELTEIAKAFSEAIIAQGLTKAELVMLNSLIESMTMHRLETTPDRVLERIADEHPAPKPPPPEPYKPAKSIQYDDNPGSPTYDPAPPMEVEKVPPRVETTGKIIAQEGEACTCKKCGKIVYTVVKDIPDNCKASDFFTSFAPFGKAPAMPDRVDISNTEGQISIDCPMCDDRKKSLYLVGGTKKQGSDEVISV
jgi:hypothetical protein